MMRDGSADGGYRVVRLTDLDGAARAEAARVFVEGYSNELETLSKDRDAWTRALTPALVSEVFYGAVDDGGHVLGIAACSNAATRAMRLDPTALRKNLGAVRGSLAALFMGGTFHKSIDDVSDGTGYVECVSTATHARGRGVATALMEHIHDLPYREFVLEVTDVNAGARRLYERFGYREYRRKPSRFPRITGYREAIWMRRVTHTRDR